MSKRMLHCFPVAIAITTALALSGCGGGSNARPDTGTGMTDDPTLTVRDGLAQGAATPVHAGSANDTLATLLPDSTNQFAPLSSTFRRDLGESTTALVNDSHIKTIASDGSNGFHVTYVVGGEEQDDSFRGGGLQRRRVHLLHGGGRRRILALVPHPIVPRNRQEPGFLSGTRMSIRARASNYHEDDDDAENEGVNNRSYFSDGARTDAANLPAGSATYAGIVDADTYLKSNPLRIHQERMKGNLRLTGKLRRQHAGWDDLRNSREDA